MNDRDREQLKNRLQALANAPMGLHLDTPQQWVINGINEPRRFFQHLPLLMEPESILYLEGVTIHPEAATFYSRHATAHPIEVACGTVFPIPDVYHLDFSPELVAGMLDLAARRPIGELFNHISGYRLASLTFSFHDAFESHLQISDRIPEPTVDAFCRALGVSYSRKLTRLHSNPYRELLYALEHPEKLTVRRQPWWRELVDGWLGGWRER